MDYKQQPHSEEIFSLSWMSAILFGIIVIGLPAVAEFSASWLRPMAWLMSILP
jgi:hypothetical protein